MIGLKRRKLKEKMMSEQPSKSTSTVPMSSRFGDVGVGAKLSSPDRAEIRDCGYLGQSW